MKVDLNDKYEYVPKWNKNEEDESPIVFYCRYMTSPERQKCIKEEVVSNDEGGTEVRVVHDEEQILKTVVEKIGNLSVDGIVITKPGELLAIRGLGSLTREVAMDAIAKNMRSDLKN